MVTIDELSSINTISEWCNNVQYGKTSGFNETTQV